MCVGVLHAHKYMAQGSCVLTSDDQFTQVRKIHPTRGSWFDKIFDAYSITFAEAIWVVKMHSYRGYTRDVILLRLKAYAINTIHKKKTSKNNWH